MNINLNGFGWMNAATASACYEIKALAPALANLLYDPVMPDRPLAILLDWAEVAIVPGSMAAFELSRVRAVLPAMVTAYIASHTYQLEPADRSGESDRLVLRDTGHGAAVARITMLLTEVVAPAHGDEGRQVGQASRSDLARALFRIIDRIKQQ
jgi:hypothetical protein